jgi:hypothetical protein
MFNFNGFRAAVHIDRHGASATGTSHRKKTFPRVTDVTAIELADIGIDSGRESGLTTFSDNNRGEQG